MYNSLSHLQSYCVGVLQAAVLALIQDVEASALVVCAVGPTGNLIYTCSIIIILTIDSCIKQKLLTLFQPFQISTIFAVKFLSIL